jgi:hypothetical protein
MIESGPGEDSVSRSGWGRWMEETRVSIEAMEETAAYICGGQGCWLYA